MRLRLRSDDRGRDTTNGDSLNDTFFLRGVDARGAAAAGATTGAGAALATNNGVALPGLRRVLTH